MLPACAGDGAGRTGTGAIAVTGSSYIPIVVPIMAFLAMGFWLVLIFYADRHPGYKHRKPQPVPDIFETDGTAGAAAGPEHERIDERSAALLG
jgi:hypothetical protein